jgi:hypothetical protein
MTDTVRDACRPRLDASELLDAWLALEQTQPHTQLVVRTLY